MHLVPIVVAAVAAILFGLAIRAYRASLRRQLGDDVVELSLYRPWAARTQRVLFVLAILLPAVGVLTLSSRDSDAGSYLAELVKSWWMVSLAYGISQGGMLLLGERGFFHATGPLVRWSDLIDFAWDRDIGQQQWGFTATIRRGRRTERLRLFVDRSHREQIDRYLEHYFSLPASPVQISAQGHHDSQPPLDSAGSRVSHHIYGTRAG